MHPAKTAFMSMLFNVAIVSGMDMCGHPPVLEFTAPMIFMVSVCLFANLALYELEQS